MFCDKLVVGFALHRTRSTDREVHQALSGLALSPFLLRGAIFSGGIFGVA